MIKFENLLHFYPIVILIAASVVAISPFLNSGFFPIHDDTQVQRVYEMKKAIMDGMFPVRWVADLGYGYGYPIFNFYGPFPYYIGGFINLLGIDAIFATKIMIAGIVFGSSFSMYLLAKQFWGRGGGLFSATLYLLAPYHALNTYVRGDVGELYAYFFIPLIFYGIWKYHISSNFKYLLVGSLSYAGLITSHNLSALMVTPFIFLIILALIVLKKKISLLALPLLGILLASFYFIPALLEMKYTNVMKIIGENSASYTEHFVCPQQLWDSLWMYGGSAAGCIDGLSFRIGKLHIVASIASFILALFFFKKEKQKSIFVLLSAVLLLFSIYFLLDLSSFVWSIVPYMNFFQYPWRFLLLVSFFSSFMGGAIVFFVFRYFKKPKQYIFIASVSLILIISPIIFYQKIFVPQGYAYKIENDYINKDFLNWETSKISDEYMPELFKAPKSPEEIHKEKIRGQNVNSANVIEKTNYLSADVIVSKDTQVLVHIPYFPAWKYSINGKRINVKEAENGVSFLLQKGTSRFEAKFEQTPIEKIANLLSLSGIGLIIAGIIYGRKSRRPGGLRPGEKNR